MMINMTIMTRRITNSYKHKRKKSRTTKIKIKIMTAKKVITRCNEKT